MVFPLGQGIVIDATIPLDSPLFNFPPFFDRVVKAVNKWAQK